MGIFEKILPKKHVEVPDTSQQTAEQPTVVNAEPQADPAKPTDAAEAAPAENSSEIKTDAPAESAEPPKAEEPKSEEAKPEEPKAEEPKADAAPIAETVADALKQMTNPFKAAIAKVKGAVTEAKESAAEPVKEAVAEVKETVAEPVKEAVAEVKETVAEPVKEAVTEVKETVAEPVKEAVAEVKESVAEPVKEAVAEVKETVAEPVKEAVAEVNETAAEPVKEAVTEVKESVAEPVKEAVTEVKESVAEPVKEAVAEVKETAAEPVKEAVAEVKETVAEPVTAETKTEVPASIVIGPKESLLSMGKRFWKAFTEKTDVIAKRIEANPIGRMLFDFADLLETIVVSMFVVMLFFTFVCCTATVDGTSMLPTLISGERLLVNRLDHTYETGDILILNSQNAYTFDENDTLIAGSGLGKNIVKRLIAQGGQTVNIDFTEGVVYVDDQPLDEPYTSTLTTRDEGAFTYPLTIPEGYVFVLGDNRSISKDSRHPQVGLIPAEDIVGSVWMRFSPFKVFSSSDDE
ncbi:MAG: signal peptidase I [Oscillospiraceae bacterium]|nr:signal peptidase I [Oscillospiraceae bacterium]